MRTYNLNVDQNKAVNCEKILVNAYEYNVTQVIITLPSPYMAEGLHRYVVLKHRDSTIAIPLTSDNIYTVGQSVTQYAGLWNAVILVSETEIGDAEADFSRTVFVSNVFPVIVRANVLTNHGEEGHDCCIAVPVEPNVLKICNDLLQLADEIRNAENARALAELQRAADEAERKSRFAQLLLDYDATKARLLAIKPKSNYELYVQICEEKGETPLSLEEWLATLGIDEGLKQDLQGLNNRITALETKTAAVTAFTNQGGDLIITFEEE